MVFCPFWAYDRTIVQEAIMTKIKTRQKIRKGILVFTLISFPIVLNYLSPAVILSGAAEGILTGSAILFMIQFALSLFLGRAFCSWVCPGGAVQSCVTNMAQDKKGPNGKANWIKFFIWAPWLGLIIFLFIQAGGLLGINPLYNTENIVSVDEPSRYFIYIPIMLLITIPAFIWGRRTMCHTICWMAPFMILGRKIRNLAKWPSLRLTVDKEKCISCGTCSQNCEMSLPVQEMVKNEKPEHMECILCLECVDGCKQKAVKVTFKAGDK